MKSALLIIFILSSLCLMFCSCGEHENVLLPKQEDGDEEISFGQLHNEILTAYASERRIFLDRMTREEATTLFVEAANRVFKNHSMQFRVDEYFVKSKLEEFRHFEEESRFSFFRPASNPELAIEFLENRGKITPERSEALLGCWKRICNPEIAPRLTSVEPVPIDPTIDIAVHSAEWWRDFYTYMDTYVESHPELQGWWDRWKKRVREAAFIASDFIGGAIASPGVVSTLAGAALASLAFTFAWPPY
jgi:hypothetical protein